MDGRRVRPADDIQRHRLMRVAAKAADLKVEIPGIQCITPMPEMAGPGLCTQASAYSMPRRRAYQPPCATPSRAPPMRGLNYRKFARVTWCPLQDAPTQQVSASRKSLRFDSLTR